MRRDLVTLAVGFVHNGPQLLQSERRYVVQDAVLADAIAAIGIHLDPVGAVHELFAHRLAAVFRPVYDLDPVMYRNVGRLTEKRLCSGNLHGPTCYLTARPRKHSAADRVEQIRGA